VLTVYVPRFWLFVFETRQQATLLDQTRKMQALPTMQGVLAAWLFVMKSLEF